MAPLLGLLRRFRAADKAVVIVTHKLHEVMAVADRVVVLRGGRVAGEVATGETTEAALARMMVGRDLAAPASRRAAPGIRPALVVSDLEARDDAGRLQVRGVGLEVRAGEILGLAGVDGNGQSTLLEALAGLRPAEGGRVVLDGAELGPLATPARRREAGLGYVPADRGGVGIVRELSIATNAALGTLGRVARLRGWWLDRARMRAEAAAIVERFDVRTPSVDFPAGKLSGGNLQKLILGREIGRAPKVLLVEQPTRGLDVGARDTVWAALLAQREAGCAILLVSAELDEITALADRIAVIVAGRVVGTLARGEADDERLGLMMAGRQGAEPPPPPPVAA